MWRVPLENSRTLPGHERNNRLQGPGRGLGRTGACIQKRWGTGVFAMPRPLLAPLRGALPSPKGEGICRLNGFTQSSLLQREGQGRPVPYTWMRRISLNAPLDRLGNFVDGS